MSIEESLDDINGIGEGKPLTIATLRKLEKFLDSIHPEEMWKIFYQEVETL